MPLHRDLTGADLHEPKGQATASINTVYVSDGAGSGTHKKLTVDSLDLSSIQDPNTVFVSGRLEDVSSASFVLIPAPEDCTFEAATIFLDAAISGSDVTLSFTRNDGSSFGSSLVIPFTGSAEGTSGTFNPTINTSITNPGYVKIASNGASTGTAAAYVICRFLRTI